MDNAPIGILDSGTGGLSVWLSLKKLLPRESLIYFGDHAHLPYSEKTTAYIRKRVIKIIKFFQQQHIKLVVIACNTATVAGINVYRQRFSGLPIIGVVPVVKTASEISKKRRFAVLSTKYTASSQYQHDLIEKFASDCHVINLACPNLVTAIENDEVKGIHVARELRKTLSQIKNSNIDCLVLGCTHFPFLSAAIRDIVGNNIRILDSGGAVARYAQFILVQNKSLASTGKPHYRFITTGDSQKATRVASKLLHQKIKFKKIKL